MHIVIYVKTLLYAKKFIRTVEFLHNITAQRPYNTSGFIIVTMMPVYVTTYTISYRHFTLHK